MRLMQRSWAALLVCATVWLVSCVDDNPVVPDQTYNADFELTGTTAIEAAMQFMRQFTEYQRSLDGKPTYGNAWDYLASNVVGTVGPSTTNAFYSPQFNQLVIFPAYMMPEIFPTDKDNANFKLFQQQMIDRYNELEVLPGVMADGVKTLNENVADLGGVSLAYDLWNEHLQTRGLTGEALRHQQRQFFISYAVVWNIYRTDEELMQQLKTDVHSVSFNRVNGISRLLDDWYDLFGVKPGDKLYLAPADRVKIW